MEARKGLAKFKPELQRMKALAESCSKQLRAWAEMLQNSDIKGPRHLNEKVKGEFERRRKAEAAQKVLLKALPAWHPLRKEAEARGEI
jgi:hypothetical protein